MGQAIRFLCLVFLHVAYANTVVTQLDEDSSASVTTQEKWGFGGVQTFGAFAMVFPSFERERYDAKKLTKRLRRTNALSKSTMGGLLGESARMRSSTGLRKGKKEQHALSQAARRATVAGATARCGGLDLEAHETAAEEQVKAQACESCNVCLKLKDGKCKTGGGHDTQSKCEGHADHVWCGASSSTPNPPSPTPDLKPIPQCGSCDVCLKLKDGKCKTGGSHNTQSKCEGRDGHVWCGAPPLSSSSTPGAASQLGESQPACPSDCNLCYEYKDEKNKCHTGDGHNTEALCTARAEHMWCGEKLDERSCREQCEFEGIDRCSDTCQQRCQDWDFQCSCESPSTEYCGLRGGFGEGKQCTNQWGNQGPTCPDKISSLGVFLTGAVNGVHDICAAWDSDLVVHGIISCRKQVFDDGICADCNGCYDQNDNQCLTDLTPDQCEDNSPDIEIQTRHWCGDTNGAVTKKEQKVCTKAEVKHLDMTSRSAGMFSIKRVSCYSNLMGAATCATFKTGLCIDIQENVFSDISNIEIGDNMDREAKIFATKASRILRDAEASGAELGTIPEQYRCGNDRNVYTRGPRDRILKKSLDQSDNGSGHLDGGSNDESVTIDFSTQDATRAQEYIMMM